MILSAFLNDLKCRWLQSDLADLEKHQTLSILLMVDFFRVFKITHFLRFLKEFLKSPGAHAKIVECILFYLNMEVQT